MIQTQDDVKLFQKIIFEACDDAQIQKLTEEQKQALRISLAQKIAFESVYKPSYKQIEVQTPEDQYHIPSFTSYLCCCFFPQHYKNTFEINNVLFRRRMLGPFIFWRSDFLQITQERENKSLPPWGPDLYGPLWLTITYIILLTLSANLNDYFSFGANPTSFKFNIDYLSTAIAIVALFRFIQIMIFPSVIGCLDGQMSYRESAYIIGYSLILYFVPLGFCVIPNKTLHMVLLLVSGAIRAIFVSRNFASRLDSQKGIPYIIIFGVELVYYNIVMSNFYNNSASTVPAATATVVADTLKKAAHFRIFQHLTLN